MGRGKSADAKGDAILAEFASAVNAVACAVEVQSQLAERNASLPADRKMRLRIGVNLGDVIVKDGTVYGDGVNIAARLEALAEPGGICVSRMVYDNIRNKLPLTCEPIGKKVLKNIAEPVEVFRVMPPGAATGGVSRTRRRGAFVLVALVLLGWTHYHQGDAGWSPDSRESYLKAVEIGRRAVAIDPSLGEAHAMLATVLLTLQKHAEAIDAAKKALAVTTNQADAVVLASWVFALTGRAGEAVLLVDRAIRRNPFTPDWYYGALGDSLLFANRVEEALPAQRKCADRDLFRFPDPEYIRRPACSLVTPPSPLLPGAGHRKSRWDGSSRQPLRSTCCEARVSSLEI